MRRRTMAVLIAVAVVALVVGAGFYLYEPSPKAYSVHARLLAELENYDFGENRKPRDESGGNGPELPAYLRIAGTQRVNDTGRPRTNRFVGRIWTCCGKYAPLGLQGPGRYYLWTDSVAKWGQDTGQVRVLVVPANGNRKMFWLRIDEIHPRVGAQASSLFIRASWQASSSQVAGMTDPMLRIVPSSLLGCADGCSSGHCSGSSVFAYDPLRDDATIQILGP